MIKMSILMILAIRIRSDPTINTFSIFLNFISTVVIRIMSSIYAEAAAQAGMKLSLISFIIKDVELINFGERNETE